jgi:hypothetical protein
VYYNGGIHPILGNRYRLVFTENLDLEKFVKVVEEEENITVNHLGVKPRGTRPVPPVEGPTVCSVVKEEIFPVAG